MHPTASPTVSDPPDLETHASRAGPSLCDASDGHALSTAEVGEMFRARGVRRTMQREVVYSALAGCTSHPTAEELHEMVRRAVPGLSLATVYNALDVFAEVGLCRRLPGASGGGPSRFDADVRPHAHVTLRDGRVLDVPHDLSEKLFATVPSDLVREVEQRMGVSVRGVTVGFAASAP